MSLAQTVATRATCDRRHVGAVIVHNLTVIATGYNGAVSGLPHCDDVGHEMESGHCARVNHAEANAICQAARYGNKTDGTEIYITTSPCWSCFKLLVNAGIKKITYGEFYQDKRIFQAAEIAGIELVHLPVPSTDYT